MGQSFFVFLHGQATKMKLTAAILIAATNAQESTVSPAQGGCRVRDKEPTATDNDAFADYFATDAFNYDAFNYGASEGDAFDTSSYEAFGDLNFGTSKAT